MFLSQAALLVSGITAMVPMLPRQQACASAAITLPEQQQGGQSTRERRSALTARTQSLFWHGKSSQGFTASRQGAGQQESPQGDSSAVRLKPTAHPDTSCTQSTSTLTLIISAVYSPDLHAETPRIFLLPFLFVFI